jgi:sirohydrochlorin cobaltochelatase
MKTHIILAMHGSPPNDFPKNELKEFFRLHSHMDHIHVEGQNDNENRYNELDIKMRNWPRTKENDPFYAGAIDMAQHLKKVTAYELSVGFNEFCAPTLDEAVDEAIVNGAEKIIVITPMMTRGGEHSELDIPQALERSKEKYPTIEIVYAWPFDISEVAGFLASQINRFI